MNYYTKNDVLSASPEMKKSLLDSNEFQLEKELRELKDEMDALLYWATAKKAKHTVRFTDADGVVRFGRHGGKRKTVDYVDYYLTLELNPKGARYSDGNRYTEYWVSNKNREYVN